MRTFVCVLIVAATILSGCAGNSEKTSTSGSDSDTSTTHTTGPTTSGTATATTSGTISNPPGNKAPTGTISANVPAGSVPINVTFSLTGTDADGDKLSWTLDADGDGKADAQQASPATLPATASHLYTAAGRYNVTYTLSDGKTSSEQKIVVNVTATGGGAAQVASGSWSYSSIDCPGASSTTAPDSVYFPAALDGKNYASLAISAATLGKTFNVTFDRKAGSGNGGIYIVDSAGAFLFRGLTGSAKYPDPNSVQDIVPAKAAKAYLFSCLNEPSAVSATYTAG